MINKPKTLAAIVQQMIANVESLSEFARASPERIAAEAQANAPAGVSVRAVGNDVVVDGPAAMWAEFGTGDFAERYTATLPEEWDELAMKYYITGEGTRKETPYLYPAFVAERKRLLEVFRKRIFKK